MTYLELLTAICTLIDNEEVDQFELVDFVKIIEVVKENREINE